LNRESELLTFINTAVLLCDAVLFKVVGSIPLTLFKSILRVCKMPDDSLLKILILLDDY